MRFVRQEWYVAALGEEVGEGLLSRRILGRSMVLYRTASGDPVALDDRCSHRGYPLSAGTRREDSIQCGYHGFTFDRCGTCVAVPGQTSIPSRTSIRAYPAIEVGPFVWVWFGDADAERSELPDKPGFDEEGWTYYSGYAPIECNYMLMVDNLLDLSHETYIHAARIGSPEVAETPIETSFDEATDTVRVWRHMESAECPPSYQHLTGLTSPINRTQDITFHAPSLYVLRTRIAKDGTEGVDGDGRAFHGKVIYAITPADDRRTHYFYAIGRDFVLDDRELDTARQEQQVALIEEDAHAVELLQRRIEDEGEVVEVSIKIDTGGLAARRAIRRRLDRETSNVASAERPFTTSQTQEQE